MHARRYTGESADGSLIVSGRYHRAPDKYPPSETWRALYTSLAPEIAIAEIVRHFTVDNLPHKVKDPRLSRLQVNLQAVVIACAPTGCRDLNVPGVSKEGFCDPKSYEVPQQFAQAAREFAEGLLVPSCTRLPPSGSTTPKTSICMRARPEA
jgi:hypothetical protein